MGAVVKSLGPVQLRGPARTAGAAGRSLTALLSHLPLLHLQTLDDSPASLLVLIIDLIKEVLTQSSLRQHESSPPIRGKSTNIKIAFFVQNRTNQMVSQTIVAKNSFMDSSVYSIIKAFGGL